jgi:hypothetical protein
MTHHCLRLARCSRLLIALGAVIALGLSGSPAQAQPSLTPEALATPAPAPQVRTEHYGLWVMAADLGGVAASYATETPLFLGTYLLAAPAVHLLHGNGKAALGSFGLRVGLPFVGFAVGSMLSDCGWADGDYCMPDRRLAGVVIGTGTALLADWLLLARKTRREPAPPPALLRAGSLRLNPDVQASHTGNMLLGLRGSF